MKLPRPHNLTNLSLKYQSTSKQSTKTRIHQKITNKVLNYYIDSNIQLYMAHMSLSVLGRGLGEKESGLQKSLLAQMAVEPVAVANHIAQEGDKAVNLYTGFLSLIATDGLDLIASIQDNLGTINSAIEASKRQGQGPGNQGLSGPQNQGFGPGFEDARKLPIRAFEVLFKGYDTYLKSTKQVAEDFKTLVQARQRPHEIGLGEKPTSPVTINLNQQNNSNYVSIEEARSMVLGQVSEINIPEDVKDLNLFERHNLKDCPQIEAMSGSETQLIKMKNIGKVEDIKEIKESELIFV